MKNLHPNNVFVKLDNPSDVLITDVGFADIPGIEPSIDCQYKFIAPELTDITPEDDVSTIVNENPGMADIWSLGKIAMYLTAGSADHDMESLDDLYLSEEVVDFLGKCLNTSPSERTHASSLINCKIFRKERIAKLKRLERNPDTEMMMKKDIIGHRMRAFS